MYGRSSACIHRPALRCWSRPHKMNEPAGSEPSYYGANMAYSKIVTADQKSRLGEAIWVNPQRMSGTPCFRGTRVPVQSLFDFLEGGETIDAFIKLYPPITREQVLAVLDFANSQLLECASSLTSA